MRGLIVIPARDEERNIATVVERARACGNQEDLLVVDDGSRDGTLAEVRRLGVRYVSHPIHLGYARALHTGIRLADEEGYDYLVFMDADQQHDPAQVSALRERAFGPEPVDVVIGSRFPEGRYEGPFGRRLGMALFARLTSLLTGRRIHDTTSGFKLLTRRAFRLVREKVYGDFHAEMVVFALLAGLGVEEVGVTVARRPFGSSMYGWLSSALYPLKTILAILVLWPQARRSRALHP